MLWNIVSWVVCNYLMLPSAKKNATPPLLYMSDKSSQHCSSMYWYILVRAKRVSNCYMQEKKN